MSNWAIPCKRKKRIWRMSNEWVYENIISDYVGIHCKDEDN